LALELAISDVDAGYGAVRALHSVSIKVEAGETVALLGTNGNGKSTLMKCVMGMVRPTKGSVFLTMDSHRHDLTKLSTEEIVNLGVALVPEGRRLFPKLTVEENLLLGGFRPQAREQIQRNRDSMFEIFIRPSAGAAAGCLRRQMLAISALMSAPHLLLVDELGRPAPILVPHHHQDQAKERSGLTVLMAEQNFRRESARDSSSSCTARS
jgi:branched-chain amino acid transport system ATP-binding protein